ncbi:MAG TPA: SEC-C metal-binding domain-containing protein [Chitinispirillaceae bacterium]|nr:SEC-C metal-binding domain-containing protein [Chitinispirillaceae bacterium]
MLKVSEENGTVDFSKVIWKFEGNEQEYSVSWDVCRSPFCGCTKLTISLCLNDTDVVSFKYDLETEEVKATDDKNTGMDIAKQFVVELTDKDRGTLIDVFKSKKVQVVKNADLTQFEVPEFPVEQIESESLLVGYDEIFPFNDEISFTYDSVTFLVADQYCLNTHCKCTNLVINIVPLEQDAVHTMFTQATAISYDYKSGKWKLVEQVGGHPEAAVLVKTLKEQHPQVNVFFSERKQRLKELYKRYRAQFQQALQQKTVHQLYSRNDPCPCGSGKKFKKCCGK